MNIGENEYFDNILIKYFLILIEINLYTYRFNSFRLNIESKKDKSPGIYEAMQEMAYLGEKIVCVNFDRSYPVKHTDNIHYFIGKNAYYLPPVPCDFLFICNNITREELDKIANFYNPKFIFHC
ncbi:hypothetical protein GAP32_164 [Cronobacter phage vB_CsaM_GAP32]|uniref:Uncharacterized protein n=1 Tax=Cronobacter phage vB_CsaM_GAP32 TaxID=1141136 RepID=K4FB27_9CAUD|nr:hypothetical protein GAP32_164 [Cronobacter phage vB_CsaM_GAP32]AFC21614.1 hypothetical protein GAP32_164 [Cronobacter phage vB_CsaM_GAP32]